MGTIHNKIVEREVKKYNSNWIVFREFTYKNFRFDILAFDPKTKEIEITEVDIASPTEEKKLKFAKTLGRVRVFRPKKKKIKVNKFQGILNAVANPVRVLMLENLNIRGNMQYSELMTSLGMSCSKDAGKFSYHLKTLLGSKLVEVENTKYKLTQKGAQVIQLCQDLDTK